MKRFEVIIHDEPHPSRNGRRYTINANGRVKLSDSRRECMGELAEMLFEKPQLIEREEGCHAYCGGRTVRIGGKG
jgi:hypothetical protein